MRLAAGLQSRRVATEMLIFNFFVKFSHFLVSLRRGVLYRDESGKFWAAVSLDLLSNWKIILFDLCFQPPLSKPSGRNVK